MVVIVVGGVLREMRGRVGWLGVWGGFRYTAMRRLKG